MKAKFLILVCLILQLAARSQMKIGDNPANINGASLLELESSNKGLVFPAVSLNDVSSPAPLPAGLLAGTTVYNTNGGIINGNGVGLYIWNGSVWMSAVTSGGSSDGWSLTGNLGTAPGANFLGTIDAADFVVKTDNTERLRIMGTSVAQGRPGYIAIGGLVVPRSILDITASLPGTNVITIQNADQTGYTSIDMRDENGLLAGTFGYANPLSGALAGKDYFNIYNKDFVIATVSANTNNFFIQGSSTGYVGVGTDVPAERLHVHGKFFLDSAFMPAGDPGTAGYVLTSAGPGLAPLWQATSGGGGSAWLLNGNSATNSGINFLGTTDNVSLRIRTNNIERMVFDSVGKVGIGTINPSNKLSIVDLANPLYLAGVQATSTFTSDSILTINAGVVKKAPYTALPSSGGGWSLTGNSGTNPVTNFIGTLDNQAFAFKVNNIPSGILDPTNRATAFGVASSASSQESVALGYNSYAVNTAAIAIGYNTVAQGLNSVAIGYGANANSDNAIILGNSTATVGIGTSTPAAGTKLDVNGSFKLGVAGNATKTSESFSGAVNVTVPANGSVEATFTIPNALATAQASVAASPSFDLPAGIYIAFARVISTNQLKVRLANTTASSQDVSGNFYFTVTEF